MNRIYNGPDAPQKGERKVTNGDRIRAMDDGQLATELCEVFDGECDHCPGKEHCKEGHTGLIDWLRKEAESENNGH